MFRIYAGFPGRSNATIFLPIGVNRSSAPTSSRLRASISAIALFGGVSLGHFDPCEVFEQDGRRCWMAHNRKGVVRPERASVLPLDHPIARLREPPSGFVQSDLSGGDDLPKRACLGT